MNGIQLWLNPVFLKQMFGAFIFCDPLSMAWDQHFHLRLGHLVAVLALNQDVFHIIGVHIADGTFDQ